MNRSGGAASGFLDAECCGASPSSRQIQEIDATAVWYFSGETNEKRSKGGNKKRVMRQEEKTQFLASARMVRDENRWSEYGVTVHLSNAFQRYSRVIQIFSTNQRTLFKL